MTGGNKKHDAGAGYMCPLKHKCGLLNMSFAGCMASVCLLVGHTPHANCNALCNATLHYPCLSTTLRRQPAGQGVELASKSETSRCCARR